MLRVMVLILGSSSLGVPILETPPLCEHGLTSNNTISLPPCGGPPSINNGIPWHLLCDVRQEAYDVSRLVQCYPAAGLQDQDGLVACSTDLL